MTTVAVLGSGNVGQALAERLLRAEATVCFGVRDPETVAGRLKGSLGSVPVLLSEAAARSAAMIVLAVPALAAVPAVRSAGKLEGKIVVDCTNPLRWEDGPVWAPPPEGSVAQALARALPSVRVIKGFNHFGAEIQRRPQLVSGPADAFFAGDDAAAKAEVMHLAARMGFTPRDAGPLRNAALLENLAVLWIQLATSGGAGRSFSFQLVPQA